jgi:hypothetical protein
MAAEISPRTNFTANWGLGLISANAAGNVNWGFKPVPFSLDNDPDWNAGAVYIDNALPSCGASVASVLKDGWTNDVDPNTGASNWQFPYMDFAKGVFPPASTYYQGGDGFRVPGGVFSANYPCFAKGRVLVIATGGYAVPMKGPIAANVRDRLRALDVCAPDPKTGRRPMCVG